MLNYSPASEKNKHVILTKLADFLADKPELLEIGSGSGQHAIYFARHLPNLIWQTSELADAVASLKENVKQYAPENVLSPVLLDVCKHPWPVQQSAAIYTANTLHIMPWNSVVQLFKGAGEVLSQRGVLSIYGPFKYSGEFTTQSNADFDQWLKRTNPLSGVRDFEAVNQLAIDQGLSLVKDYSMPANNQLLIFKPD